MVEFTTGPRPSAQAVYQLILRRGSARFLVEVLEDDDHHPWVKRWRAFGRGLVDVLSAIHYVQMGNVQFSVGEAVCYA
jgi:hypothetical protein